MVVDIVDSEQILHSAINVPGLTELVEWKVKSEVDKRFQGTAAAGIQAPAAAFQGQVEVLQATLAEAQQLHQRLLKTLQCYAEQVPRAESLCQTLAEQLEPAPAVGCASDPPSHTQTNHTHTYTHTQLQQGQRQWQTQTWYRNIKYVDCATAYDSEALRLGVHETPSLSAPRRGTLEFGALLPIMATQPQQSFQPQGLGQQHGHGLWLQLGPGAIFSRQDLQGCWVQARLEDGSVQCAEVKMAGEGRPDPEEYSGQSFGRFYTEGFDGPRDAVILSASGQAFWPTLNLSCMLRGIAMATVFERDWADGSEGFAAWVPYYAVNVYRFGLAGRRKRMFVTVKPTANWRRYAGPDGMSVPDPDSVKLDIGEAQFSECEWLFGMSRKLGVDWKEIKFMTPLSFLRAQVQWTAEQCIEESLLELERAQRNFNTLHEDEMEKVLFAQLFSLEEALGFDDLQTKLAVDLGDRRTPTHPVQLPGLPAADPATVKAARARGLATLADMLRLWKGRRGSFLRTLQDLKLEPEDLDDLGTLIDPQRYVLHAAARSGQRQVLCAVLDGLRKADHLRGWLVRKDQQGQTPLHAALQARQSDAAAILLKEVANKKQLGRLLEMVDGNGCSIVHLAASAGNVEAVLAYLAESELTSNTLSLLTLKNKRHETPLDLALHQVSLLTVMLSAGSGFEEVRQWLVRQVEAVQTEADAATIDTLAGLLQQTDPQGRRWLSSFPQKERKEVLRALAAAESRTGGLRCFQWLLREAARVGDTALTKELLEAAEAAEALLDPAVLCELLDRALAAAGSGQGSQGGQGSQSSQGSDDGLLGAVLTAGKCRAPGSRWQEVLHELACSGSPESLCYLLRLNCAASAPPQAVQLHEALRHDDELLAKMLSTLHVAGQLQKEMEKLAVSDSLSGLSRLLTCLLAHNNNSGSVGDLSEVLGVFLEAVWSARRLEEVFQFYAVSCSRECLSDLVQHLSVRQSAHGEEIVSGEELLCQLSRALQKADRREEVAALRAAPSEPSSKRQ